MKKKIIAIVVLIVLIIASGFYYVSIDKTNKEIDNTISENNEVVETISPYEEYRLLNQENKSLNDDYVGIVSFESGLIEYPFVVPTKALSDYTIYDNYGKVVTDLENGCEGGTCTLNDAYLRTDWQSNKYNLGGSVFMDYRNSLDDQNIIIYGHHFDEASDPTRSLYFTKLELLLNEEYYKDNKYVNLYLEDEVRKYELYAAYKFDVYSESDYENLQYFRTNYNYNYYNELDEGYYDSYIENVDKVKEYKTETILTNSDNTLTLQTCIGTSGQYIQIVLFKEIERTKY